MNTRLLPHRSASEPAGPAARFALFSAKENRRHQWKLGLCCVVACCLLAGCHSAQQGDASVVQPTASAAPAAEAPAAPIAPGTTATDVVPAVPTFESRIQRAHALFASGKLNAALALYRAVISDGAWPTLEPERQVEIWLRAGLLLLQPGRDGADWQLAKRYLDGVRATWSELDSPTPSAERAPDTADLDRQAALRERQLTAELVLRLQQDLERQYRRLEELKQIDLEEAAQPVGPTPEPREPPP